MRRTGLDRIWTIPNAISFLRLLTVPVFFWLLVSGNFTWALGVLLFATSSDFIDGFIARRFNQITRLGMYLDPISDRLFIAASVLALVIRDLIPVALVAVIIARDLVLLTVFLARRLRIRDAPRVTFIGKTGTFVLFVAFPVIVLGEVLPDVALPLDAVGWALGVVGGVIYWVAGVGYLRALIRTTPSSTAPPAVL
jgi:cardiolipin synthase